jgi:hypothetical protein
VAEREKSGKTEKEEENLLPKAKYTLCEESNFKDRQIVSEIL